MGFDLELSALLIVLATFAVGGLVKGLIAFGLPLIMVPLLSLVFPVPTAVALIALPILFSNVWQIIEGERRDPGVFRHTAMRFWTLIAALVVAIAFSTHLLVEWDEHIIAIIAGSVVLIVAISDFLGFKLSVSPRHERLVAPLIGAAGGLVGGVTSFFGTLPLMYLMALKIPKDQFVVAASVILLSGGIALMAMLSKLDVLGLDELVLSALGLPALLIGMSIGQRMRARVDQARFRHMILIALGIVGVVMIARAIV